MVSGRKVDFRNVNKPAVSLNVRYLRVLSLRWDRFFCSDLISAQIYSNLMRFFAQNERIGFAHGPLCFADVKQGHLFQESNLIFGNNLRFEPNVLLTWDNPNMKRNHRFPEQI